MNNENETAAALERARCEVRFFREVLEQIATPGPRVRRLKLAQAALGFWASLRGSEARIAPERIVDAEGRLVQERDELLREHSAMLGRIAAETADYCDHPHCTTEQAVRHSLSEVLRLRAENAEALDALKLMADQYLAAQIDGREVYDHRFMAAGEACLEVLIAAGVIDESQDYRRGGKSPNEVAERRAQQKGNE